jgi:glucose/mannose-6-phosphate isomerase
MKTLVEQFPSQLSKAIEIGRSAKLRAAKNEIRNVLITGLGGSGIGGTIISELAFPECPVPVQVSKGYFIPSYTNANTLVIVSSYSGNTEETLACMKQAFEKGASVCAITSGGAVEEFAKTNNLDCILIPGGMPPRSCLGYSLTQLVAILSHHQLISADHLGNIEKANALISKKQDDIIAQSKSIAQFLLGKIPVIYSTTLFEGVAIRFRQQLNENSKVLCWHHVIPEMNHNELVGWAGGTEEYAVIVFRDSSEYERNAYRIQLNKEIITRYTPHYLEILTEGNSYLEKAVYLIHLGDWISVELASLRGVDPVEVNVINFLKGELSKK